MGHGALRTQNVSLNNACMPTVCKWYRRNDGYLTLQVWTSCSLLCLGSDKRSFFSGTPGTHNGLDAGCYRVGVSTSSAWVWSRARLSLRDHQLPQQQWRHRDVISDVTASRHFPIIAAAGRRWHRHARKWVL